MTARKVKQYGRLAVGQLVHYSAAVLAPTNSAQPCGCRRDGPGGPIIHPDNTVSFHAVGKVAELLETESGAWASVVLPCGGQIRPHVNSYGQACREAALEEAAQAAIDACGFNGATVQLEAHIRTAIKEMK